MDYAFTAKMICDLSLWYCTAGFILSFFGAEANIIQLLIMAVLSSASCFLSEKKTALRFIPLPFLLICFLWVRGFADILLLLPPLAYCVFLCYGERFSPDYGECAGFFKTAALILLALTVFILIMSGTNHLKSVFEFLFIFLFSGVLTLRILRHDERNRKDVKFQIIDLAALIICCAAAIFLSSSLFLDAALKALGALYHTIIAPLLFVLSYILVGIAWLFVQIMSLLKIKVNGHEVKLQTDSGKDILKIDPNIQTSTPALLTQIFTALGIIAFLVLAFFIFRRLAARKNERSGTAYTQSSFTTEAFDRPTLRSVLSPQTPRDAVRRYYRKFLQNAKSNGIAIKPCDTSESVSELSSERFDPNLLSGLRELYIVARYSPDEVTKEDAKRAKEFYSKLKAKKEQ